MLVDVTVHFNNALRVKFGHKPDILKFLLEHERKDLCLKNLCNQIEIAERRGRFRLDFDVTKYILMINEMAVMFARAAVNARINELMSSAEKHRRQSEATKYDEIKSVVKGLDDEDEQGNDR